LEAENIQRLNERSIEAAEWEKRSLRAPFGHLLRKTTDRFQVAGSALELTAMGA